MYCDNQPAIHIAENFIFHERTSYWDRLLYGAPGGRS